MRPDIRPHPCPSPGHAGLFMAGCLRGRGFTGKNGLSGEKSPAQPIFADGLMNCPDLSPYRRERGVRREGFGNPPHPLPLPREMRAALVKESPGKGFKPSKKGFSLHMLYFNVAYPILVIRLRRAGSGCAAKPRLSNKLGSRR